MVVSCQPRFEFASRCQKPFSVFPQMDRDVTFHKKEIEFLEECAFLHFLQHECKNIATINGKNAFGYPLRLGLYLKVERMNLNETNFGRTAESQRSWQGAICHVWTLQFDKHWRQSQKQLQKYNIRDKDT